MLLKHHRLRRRARHTASDTTAAVPRLCPLASLSAAAATMGRLSVPVLEVDPAELTGRRALGDGTTAAVEAAVLHSLPVAVKTLRPPEQIAEPLTRQRAPADFRNEFELNVALRHPNIVMLIGCVRDPDLTSLVFELCDGVSRALCFAHRLGIMHRDVKPSQVVFAGETPKLADWGLATFFDSERCASGETGTWEFMAPEVIRHEKYSAPADVYSFAVLMHCILHGEEYPYRDRYITPAQAALAVANKDLRPNVHSKVPEGLQQVLKMCWAKDPAMRPAMDQVVFMVEQTAQSNILSKLPSRSSGALASWFRSA